MTVAQPSSHIRISSITSDLMGLPVVEERESERGDVPRAGSGSDPLETLSSRFMEYMMGPPLSQAKEIASSPRAQAATGFLAMLVESPAARGRSPGRGKGFDASHQELNDANQDGLKRVGGTHLGAPRVAAPVPAAVSCGMQEATPRWGSPRNEEVATKVASHEPFLWLNMDFSR